ncbi:hypothetical protein ALC56_04615 [Trachymyrmex septentrionalis]|uniref:Uncharacterized protein n=1 Tax=Trachymyrmex septentrionalis TaxID=34720 RepID=A0A195FL81_9HYME|nr:hypothetical protein ALC56_04615 [Trachymyrmex septentrionalis]
MMRFEEGETLKDKSRCANIRADLKMCLLQSDCCKITANAATTQRHIFLYVCILIIDGRRRFRGPRGY